MTVEALQEMACAQADLAGIDQDLFKRLVAQESSWNPLAGEGGAHVGLCQLSVRFGWWFVEIHGARLGIPGYKGARRWTEDHLREVLMNPLWNLGLGAQEMRRLVNHHGTWHEALAAWNWGTGNMSHLKEEHPDVWMARLPAETQYMIAKVMCKDGLDKYT